MQLEFKSREFLRSLQRWHFCRSIVGHVCPQRLVDAKEQVNHTLAQGVFKVIVVVTPDRSDQLWDRVHKRLLVLLELGMVRYTATVLDADVVSHSVVHAHDRVEQRRFQVSGRDAVRDAKLAQLAQKHLEADHCLSEVSPI